MFFLTLLQMAWLGFSLSPTSMSWPGVELASVGCVAPLIQDALSFELLLPWLSPLCTVYYVCVFLYISSTIRWVPHYLSHSATFNLLHSVSPHSIVLKLVENLMFGRDCSQPCVCVWSGLLLIRSGKWSKRVFLRVPFSIPGLRSLRPSQVWTNLSSSAAFSHSSEALWSHWSASLATQFITWDPPITE